MWSLGSNYLECSFGKWFWGFLGNLGRKNALMGSWYIAWCPWDRDKGSDLPTLLLRFLSLLSYILCVWVCLTTDHILIMILPLTLEYVRAQLMTYLSHEYFKVCFVINFLRITVWLMCLLEIYSCFPQMYFYSLGYVFMIFW